MKHTENEHQKFSVKSFRYLITHCWNFCYRSISLMKTLIEKFRFPSSSLEAIFKEAWRKFSPCLSSSIWNRNKTEDKVFQQNFLVDHFSYEASYDFLPPSNSISSKLSVKHIVACGRTFFLSTPPSFSLKHSMVRQKLEEWKWMWQGVIFQ